MSESSASVRIVDLGDKKAMIGFQTYKGRAQFVLRYLYEDPETQRMLPGKNGITVPAAVILDVLHEILTSYNNAMDTTLVLVEAPKCSPM